MKTQHRVLAAIAVAGAALAGSIVSATPASAYTAWNTWGYGNYHAGSDGVAKGKSSTLYGYGCSGGDAKYFYVSLHRTKDKAKIHSTTSWLVKGTSSKPTVDSEGYASGTAAGTSYYIRWYGQWGDQTNGATAPCAGGGFTA